LVLLCEALPEKKIDSIIEQQFVPPWFSAAANYSTACNTQTKSPFLQSLAFPSKKIDEAVFWLEMIRDVNLLPETKPEWFITEGAELTKILCACRRSAIQNLKLKNYQ
jgi:four helix bundle protein